MTTLVSLLSISVTGFIAAVGALFKVLNDNRTLRSTVESLTAALNEMKMSQMVTNEVMRAVKAITAEKASG